MSFNVFGKLSRAVAGKSVIDELVLDDIEEALISSDIGVETTLKIIEKLEELHLSIDYEPIKQFYDIMFNYIRTGERIIVNIPFPQMNKRIEGVLATNIREEVALRLKYEKY